MNASGFSILIPTWNNLAYLKCCLSSLEKNSALSHQVIVHANEGTDGTLEWLRQNNIAHTFSETNAGVCKALNAAFSLAKKDFIVFMNDDMYACKSWDSFLAEEINKMSTGLFMLSSTMIEPVDTHNPCVIVSDFGNSTENFREEDLNNSSFEKEDWQGASWPPVLLPKQLWEEVGGLSEEFSPGMYSDPDLSMKLWQKGCRIFKGVGKSQVYHFQQKSTSKVRKNDGRKQFLKKWGILPSVFYKYYLRMGQSWQGALPEPERTWGYKMNVWRSAMLSRFNS